MRRGFGSRVSPRHSIATFVVLAALTAASSAHALSYGEARHLLARTGFSATDAEIRSLAPDTHRDAVARLLRSSRQVAVTPAPNWIDEPVRPAKRPRDMSESERKKFRRTTIERAIGLKAWWYREMVVTPSQLTERMTLFWHNHFTSSLRKVKSPQLMYRQNATLRRHALGNFGDLLRAIAQDPAMLLYLDNATNRRGRPNENFARELLELFTLGEGHYGERDIKEAARAFTGWSLDRKTGAFRVYKRLHDGGTKEFLGRRGRFDGDDIVEILLAHPRTAVLITEKLWRRFVSDTPEPGEIRRIAGQFRDSGYEIKVALAEILATPQFRSPENRGALIKSPVELLAGTVRLFDVPLRDYRILVRAGRALGQDVFTPPNVKGWSGGTAWITADTLLLRQQVLQRFTRAAPNGKAAKANTKRRMRNGGLARWVTGLGSEQRDPDALTSLLVPVAPVNPPAHSDDPARIVRNLLLDPTYQLK